LNSVLEDPSEDLDEDPQAELRRAATIAAIIAEMAILFSSVNPVRMGFSIARIDWDLTLARNSWAFRLEENGILVRSKYLKSME